MHPVFVCFATPFARSASEIKVAVKIISVTQYPESHERLTRINARACGFVVHAKLNAYHRNPSMESGIANQTTMAEGIDWKALADSCRKQKKGLRLNA